MRILNSKNKETFKGVVVVCEKNVYINTETGEGFCGMFDAMGGYVNSLASIILPITDDMLEAKQEVYLTMLEGLISYNHSFGVPLSTFLYKYTQNKLFDLLRKSENKVLKFSADDFNGTLLILDNIFGWNEFDYVELKLDFEKRIKVWSPEWQAIMVRLFVDGEKVQDVARDTGMTPWGLTRAVRRKLEKARNI